MKLYFFFFSVSKGEKKGPLLAAPTTEEVIEWPNERSVSGREVERSKL